MPTVAPSTPPTLEAMTTGMNTLGRRVLHRVLVVFGSVSLTTAFFLLLPLLQQISGRGHPDTLIVAAEVAALPPPPPPPPVDEPEEEPEPEEPPPDIQPAQLDISQLDVLLGEGGGSGGFGAGFVAKLGNLTGGDDEEAFFSIDDLDQQPRVLEYVNPTMTKAMQRIGGRVIVLFRVDERGNVTSPIVKKASDPMFKKPALDAIGKWKFEPGRRDGKPVAFRMRQQIDFPKQ